MSNSAFTKTKRYFFIILTFALLIAAGVLYFKLNTAYKTLKQAQVFEQKAQKYDIQQEQITTEVARCKQFITSGTGTIGQFEYCKGFVEFFK